MLIWLFIICELFGFDILRYAIRLFTIQRTADHHTSGTILSQDGGNALRNDGHTEYYANQNSWNNPNAWNGMQWPAFPSFGRR
uniref:Secreted protein n=1 Tax=Globodera rostochiensis TaxID=31243 RepID=A0A914HWX1_GLORO